jgi:16S rRNA (guanine(966)-N(2))-methyltransferase RsmD
VELYSIDKGWNESALLGTDDGLRGWVVESMRDTFYSVSGQGDVVELEQEDDIDEFDVLGQSTGSFDDDFVELEGGLDGNGATPYQASSPKRKNSSTNSSLDYSERALLDSFPKHIAKQLLAAHEERKQTSPAEQKKAAARLKTHRRLKIISGTAAGVRIVSPQGDQTRPMMELVRGAVFSMIASLHGCTESALPNETRWLDLFAGTGAVGIEALSRGVGEAHFVELSPWVVRNCLEKNLELCGLEDCAIIHSTKAEDYLKRHHASQQRELSKVSSNVNKVKAFDFISCCPPYENVSYTELFSLLDDSALIHSNTILVVEYPRKAVSEIPDIVGPLFKLRDRKYGRTLVAIYGPQIAE